MWLLKPHCVLCLLLFWLSHGIAQTFTDCGGTREGPSGAIVSPNYPSSYPNNARCNWTITAQANEIIDLNITFLDLDGYVDSCPDVVTIYDGESSRATPLQQLCRYKTEAELKRLQIRSTGNKIYVVFTSDAINQRPGFLINFNTFVCAPLMYGVSKCNNSCPCNPNNTAYCNNLNGTCYCKPGWTSARCDVDVNECADPKVEKCPFDYQTCVNTPGGFSCECKPGLVKNSSNNCVARSSPRCTVQCSHLCGVTGNNAQVCYCPNYMMLSGVSCIACPPMRYGSNCSRTCNCDATHTTKCDSVTGNCTCETGWKGDACSDDVDECKLSQYLSTCNSAYNQICVNTPGSYRCDCVSGFVKNTVGIGCVRPACDYNISTSPSPIVSFNFPTIYWPNAVCSWLIQAEPTSTISVNFCAFQTEKNYDYVYFYDGPNTTSRLLGKFSGETPFGDPIRSTSNRMLIRFTTDGSVEYTGISGIYTKSSYPQGCSNTVVAANTNLTTIGTSLTKGNPATVNRIFCYWSISAPLNSVISINFASLSTDQTCKSFVAVYQGTHSGDPLNNKFCGTANPGVIRVSGPNAYIVYQSEEDTPRSGFRATVNYCAPFYYGLDLCTTPCSCVQANTQSCNSSTGACSCKSGWTSATCAVDVDECLVKPCSLTEKCINTPGSYRCEPNCTYELSGNFGTISTVQYPTYTLHNAQCKWTITAGTNLVVTLNLPNGKFQLFESAYCTTDYLNIYNSDVTTANQIGKYCGTRIPEIIRSTTNKMVLQLSTSAYYYSRKGFAGFYYTHECREFTYGSKCERPCTCARDNTKFCDNISGVCVCKTGWTGTNCDEDVNECSTGKCPENQACANTAGSYVCTCLPGYTKNLLGMCEGNSRNCVSAEKKCSHFCVTENNVLTCICPDGMEIGGSNKDQCIPKLYPYGGDTKKSVKFEEVTFSNQVPVGDQTVNKAYIHSSGVISFEEVASVPPTHDPNKLLLEAFWANISESSVEVYYHLYEKCEPNVFLEGTAASSPSKQIVMERAARDVIRLTSFADFDVNLVLVTTWKNVTALSTKVGSQAQNLFQAIFVSGNRKESSSDQEFSSEETSYVFYIYPKDKLLWCNNVIIGVCAGPFTRSVPGLTNSCLKVLPQTLSFQVGRKTSPAQQCQRYVCKNSRQITNPVYRQEIEQLYKCPCTLDRLGLQWGFYEKRSPDIYCFSIRLVAKRRLLVTNPRNKLCCYRWNKPADNSNWQVWAQQLSLATFVQNSPDAGHVIPGDPEWFYDGVRENINAHQWCCKDANKAKLCERFDKIYPNMECSYYAEFVPGYLLGDPTIVTLDNVTYLMNGWGEYVLMDVPYENFTLQARTDRIHTSRGLSNGTVFTAFAAKDGYGTQFQVELSDSKTSLEIQAKGLNLTDEFYRQLDFKLTHEDIEIFRDDSRNKTKVVVTFPCGVSMIVRVGVQNLELEMQVVKTLQNKTKGLLGNFNGKIDDEFTLPNGTVLSANLTESQIFYQFSREYLVKANTSVFIYKTGKTALDYQHPEFVPVFLDSLNTTSIQAAVRVCGAKRSACIYDYYITNDSTFALNTDNTMKQSIAQLVLLANNCPNVTIVRNENYTDGRWFVQDGVVNTLRINATDADKDVLTYSLYESVTGVSINQSGFLLYTPSTASPVNIGFRVNDSYCYTPVVNIKTAICPRCRNNGRCNRNKTRDVEYFGGQVQILKCICPPGYTGDNCESELDACLSKPCSKGKTCTDLTAAQQGNKTVGYACGPCPKGYAEVEGMCVDIDECVNVSACHHTCENTEGSFVCGCNTGYVFNRTDSRTCLAKNCSDRCVMSNTLYCDETASICVCKPDIKTADCSVVVDYCASNPCPSNKKCRNKSNGYECRCMNGLLPVNSICTDCNRNLTEPSGSFMSSNYPDNYPNGQSCTWTIRSNDTNSLILLNFTSYQVEGCPYDYLEVYDGPSMASDVIGQYCNDGIPDPISSSGNSLTLHFTSDTSVTKKGFFASYFVESQCKIKKCSHDCKLVSVSPRVEQCLCPEWTRLDSTETKCLEINACNTTVAGSSGFIVSPGYPQNYRANASCYWAIPSQFRGTTTISFSDMDIESGVSCSYDSLKIYNGMSSSSPLLGVYCGSSLPRSISSTNSLYLVFTSDGLISGRGFKIKYNYDGMYYAFTR